MIPVLQDNPLLEPSIWDIMGAVKDDILVFDRCGRLTYHVIMPWSMLTYPYVKAALLSTFHDEPCGPCNGTTVSHYEQEHQQQPESEGRRDHTQVNSTYAERLLLPQSEHHKEDSINGQISTNSTTNVTLGEEPETSVVAPPTALQEESVSRHYMPTSTAREGSGNATTTAEAESTTAAAFDFEDEGETPPIRIVMRYPHSHQRPDGRLERQDFLVMRTGDSNYHGHLDGNSDAQEVRRGVNGRQGNSIRREDPEEDERRRVIEGYPLWRNTWDHRSNGSRREENLVRKRAEDDIREGATHFRDTEVEEVTGEQESELGDDDSLKQRMIEHYKKLLPWINYTL